MIHSILQEARLYVHRLPAGAGCLIFAGVLTLWALVVWGGLIMLLLYAYVLNPQQAQWVFVIKQCISVKAFHGVDCHALFTPCEDWPTREELKRLLASDIDTLRRLEEITLILDVVASRSKCAGKSMLDVGHSSTRDIRPVGELLRQLEEESGMDIPCILGNL